MGKVRSAGVTVFGWAEIILGGIGTAIFIFFTIGFIYCLFYPAETEIGRAISLATMIIFLAVPLFLWCRKVYSCGAQVKHFPNPKG